MLDLGRSSLGCCRGYLSSFGLKRRPTDAGSGSLEPKRPSPALARAVQARSASEDGRPTPDLGRSSLGSPRRLSPGLSELVRPQTMAD
ncbi:hypothetical protein NL676_000996 [Syzygium grande]|nr:hypothetical protein NL676_000996 [Syzygium grande]